MLRFLTIVCLAAFASATAPGVKITFSQSGLNYIEKVAVDILLQQLAHVKIPDISGSVGTPIGSIEYSLTSIDLHSLEVPKRSVQLQPGEGLKDTISGVTAAVSLHWHYREKSWPHASDSGSADVSISGSSIEVIVDIGEANSRPTIKTKLCSVDINHLDIHLHGGASWLYNIFISSFAGQIKSAVNKALRSEITSAINSQAEKALATMPIDVKVDKWSNVNYAMVSAPTITSSLVTSNHLGEFIMNKNPVPFPWNPPTLPDSFSNDEIQIVLSAESVLSAGHVYYKSGFFNFNVTQAEVPASFPFKLNTSSFKDLLPQLYQKYPNDAMKLHIHENAEPRFTTSAQGILIEMPVSIDVFASPSKDVWAPCFSLDVSVETEGTVTIGGGSKIIGDIVFLNCTIKITKSQVGTFPATILQDVLNTLFKTVLVPLVDKAIKNGVPIPVVDGVQLLNPKVSYVANHIAIGCDIHYNG